MHAPTAVPGIRFNDCIFGEPTPLNGWTPPQCAGLFVVLAADPNWAPRAVQPLYFGEFGNNAAAASLLENYSSLLTAARGRTLLVAVFTIPFSTTAQRLAVRRELIWGYNPVCQTTEPDAGVFGAQLNHSAPAERRRRIGFMPQCEPAA